MDGEWRTDYGARKEGRPGEKRRVKSGEEEREKERMKTDAQRDGNRVTKRPRRRSDTN